MKARHFLTCGDCLQRIYVEAPAGQRFDDVRCSACAGRMTWHGTLNNGRVEFETEGPPCNLLCVDAAGRSCVCACGGRNHGSHLLVPFTVTHTGPIIVHTLPDAEAIRIAEEYRAARGALIDTVRESWEKRRRGEWMPAGEFDRVLDVERRLHRARGLKTHAGRMKALGAVPAAAAVAPVQGAML